MLLFVAQILTILAPAALLAVIGVVWAKFGPKFEVKFVSTLVVSIGMPAFMFHTLATSEVDISSLGDMFLAALCVHVLFAIIIVILLKRAEKDWRLCIAHVCGNTGNLGLPVCLYAFGPDGLAYAMAFFSVQCLLLFSIGEAVLTGSASIKPALRSPILHAVWLGILVRYLGLEIPQFFMDTTALVGQMVIPIMLITLGVSLASMSVSSLPSTLRWSLLRTLIGLVVGFGIAEVFGLEGVARAVLIVETAVPVAVFNFLLAVKHERDVTEVSGLILVSHLTAIVYLPFLLGFLLLNL